MVVPNIYIKLPYFQTITCTQILEGISYKKNADIPSEYMINADCRQHFPQATASYTPKYMVYFHSTIITQDEKTEIYRQYATFSLAFSV